MIYVIVGGYVVASFFMFKNPRLLHKKKEIEFISQNVCHRGGAGEYYENTITAFRHSLAAGSKMIELDCHLTKDKKVAVIHDNCLLRLTGFKKFVTSVNYEDLPTLSESVPIDFEPGMSFTVERDLNNADRRIPLLEEVFRLFPYTPVNIDIKQNDDDLIEEVSYLITKYNREESTVWGNVDYRVTEKCYKKNSKVNLLFSRKRVCTLLFLYYTGLLPFVPLKETHLEIFLPSIYGKWPEAQTRPLLCRYLLKFMGALLMRKSLFWHLRERGLQVYLWVLNNDEEFETAFKLGVTGVMTDYPSKLQKFLNDHPQYRIEDLDKNLSISEE